MTDIPEMQEERPAFMTTGEAQAEALRIAERRLLRLGWSHSPKEIGSCARDILEGLSDVSHAAAIRRGE